MLTFVKSVLLCGSVRERMQEARWGEYLSQIITDEQKRFCSQGELTNACKQTTDITERYSQRELIRSVLSVDLMSLCAFV